MRVDWMQVVERAHLQIRALPPLSVVLAPYPSRPSNPVHVCTPEPKAASYMMRMKNDDDGDDILLDLV